MIYKIVLNFIYTNIIAPVGAVHSTYGSIILLKFVYVLSSSLTSLKIVKLNILLVGKVVGRCWTCCIGRK